MTMNRKWLPSFVDLIDRQSIFQLKEVMIPQNKDVYAQEMKNISHDLSQIIEENQPDWIINCGAYTQVDAAEKNILLSNKINGYAPAAFVDAINEINTNLLHISSDFVFDGNQNFPYTENQERNQKKIPFGCFKSGKVECRIWQRDRRI